MSRCARSRESPALLSLAAGLLCLAVSLGKTARAGDVALGAVLLRGIRAALEIAKEMIAAGRPKFAGPMVQAVPVGTPETA